MITAYSSQNSKRAAPTSRSSHLTEPPTPSPLSVNGDPKVSVVIPVYNQGGYLREALDSVIAQTYRETEIIVVDDGSTDNTPSVMASYGDRIIGLHKANGGGASAINLGTKIARGKWIAWLSADDLWEPNKLSRQLQVVETKPSVALVYTDYCWIDPEGRTTGRRHTHQPGSRRRALLRLAFE